MVYLSLGHRRSIAAACEKAGYSLNSVRRWEQWSSDNDWVARCRAYDDEQLLKSMERRERDAERVRQKIYDGALDILETYLGLNKGEMDLGSTTEIMDKHQNVVGERPLVPASVRARTCEHALGLIGLVTPKRVELTGKDGDAIRLQAHAALGQLPPDQLFALAKAFGVQEDDDGE
jgi:hypothetical protein